VKQQSSQDRRAPLAVDPPRHFVSVQSRGTIALPAELRRRLHLDEPGAQVVLDEREDGVVELRAVLPIPAEQRWYWTERWQAMEREVDDHAAAGRTTTLPDADALFEHLDRHGDLDRPPTSRSRAR
jgi:bifunctional DNA-binding transcriptional regulator/antitoxin component of YhaV-PrlF toxin-antitoxin module